MEIFTEQWAEAERLREATLVVVVRHSEELVNDFVVYDLLQGDPLMALTRSMSRCLHAAEG